MQSRIWIGSTLRRETEHFIPERARPRHRNRWNIGGSTMRIRIAVILILIGSTPAAAVDGVLEINQSCAVNSGCFSGETAGFPVSITNSGSYRLTSDLSVSGVGLSAITLANGLTDVTLDLNGFEIEGPGSGTGHGVSLDANSNVEIRNGTISDFGYSGVSGVTSSHSRVLDLRVHGNGLRGISLPGNGNRIEVCRVASNGGGIDIGNAGLVRGCTIVENLGSGIFVSEGLVGPAEAATITDNQVYENEGDGINCSSDSCLVTHNLVVGNDDKGIHAGGGSLIANNVVRANASSATTNDGGIVAFGRSTVRDNTVRNNSYNNIAISGSGNAVVRNHITQGANGISFLTGSSNNLYADNLLHGNTVDVANPSGGTDGGGNVSY